MKRFIAILCVLIMIFAVSACGSESVQTPPADVEPDNAVQNAPETEDKTDETDEDTAPEIKAFEEIVVVDNDDCTIKITGVDPDNMWGYTVNAYFENKSADKTFMFSVTSAAVNGVEADPFFAAEVAAGKKSNEEITFTNSELEKNGVGDFTDIELNFSVYDSNDWMADDITEETVHIYPYGEENAVSFVRTPGEEDVVLADNEYATVTAIGYEWDDIWGYTVNIYIVNKTDTSIMVSVDEASINGYMADPFYATSVGAGKCAFSAISWYEDDLEANGITEVENIEFALKVYDENDWMAEDFINEVVTLNP